MKVKEIFTDDSKWVQRAVATDNDGNTVGVSDDKAVCFCLFGAIDKCYGKSINRFISVLRSVREEIRSVYSDESTYEANIYEWNDDPKRTFEEVKALVELLDI